MKNLSDEELLKKHGWEIHCVSPFDIFHPETGSSASRLGADAVIRYLRDEEDDFIERLYLIKGAYKANLIGWELFVTEMIKVLEEDE